MRWVLLVVVLLLGAALVLGLLGRSLWRRTKALSAEVTEASDRLAAVAASLSELAELADAASEPRHNDPGTTQPTARPDMRERGSYLR